MIRLYVELRCDTETCRSVYAAEGHEMKSAARTLRGAKRAGWLIGPRSHLCQTCRGPVDAARAAVEEALTEALSEDGFAVDQMAEPRYGIQVGPGRLVNVHKPEACEGRGCPIHHPSNHHMRDWPTNWRGDRHLMERLCRHGIGHPDPDDIAYKATVMGEEAAGYEGVHGCDGCCRPPAEEPT